MKIIDIRKKIFQSVTLIVILVLLCVQDVYPQSNEILSPNENVKVKFLMDDGIPYYSVEYSGNIIIGKSKLGFELKDNTNFPNRFSVGNLERNSFDETWNQPWGEVKSIRNNYNQLTVELTPIDKNKCVLKIIFRVYDYGLGFRYEFPEEDEVNSIKIADELTEFNLIENHNAWWIDAYQENRYEYLYNSGYLNEIKIAHTPLTLKTKSGTYLSIHEAALVDFASMTLEVKENNVLKANLVPWSDGVKVVGSLPVKSPWRTIEVADSPGELITSYLILNLNEPNKLKDTEWIKPGKYVGIWWEYHLDKSTWSSGARHGATTSNTKKYIDFASKYGFDGVLVEGWNYGWDGDWIKNGENFSFTKAYEDFDIKEIVKYAAERNVSLIGHNETGGAVLNYEEQLSDAFKLYNSLGIKAVKTGYVNYGRSIKRIDENGKPQFETHHGQFMVRHYQKVVDEAAMNKIMINAHEPIKATGLRRTYPNMLSREGARGQEFNAWSPDGGNPPDHTTILPFTRLLGGPMDFTPGIFDLLFEKEKPNNRVNTTLAKQLALYVVLYSPLQMAADLPGNYEKNLKPFKFIIDVPVDWEDTKVLNASIGDYVTIVRKDRNSDDWYLGSITDENKRTFEIKLDFLEPGKKYKAEIYSDGKDADWENNPYRIDIEEKIVTNKTIIELKLAAGGGQAIRFSLYD
ncbi:MAG: glycoside hydrolase family 97 protein [Melioribacteraceae bacterium]|nr:glycoside hydrolase family 97 protein [Melioribacteraceae bacterium]